VEKKFISLVVYLHNDEKRIRKFLERTHDTIAKSFEQYEMIFVNDSCMDSTVEIIKEYVKEKKVESLVSVIHMGFFQGIEASMNAGRDIAIGDFVYEFDDVITDYDTSLIFEAYTKLISGYDIVSACSDAKRRVTSKIFYSLFNKYSKGVGKIGSETFRIVSRRAINRIKSMGNYIPYRKAVYANCGLATTSLIYKCNGDERKKSKNHKFGERKSLALDSFIYFTNIMERVSAFVSGVFLILSIVMLTYTAIDYFTERGIAEGWASTVGFMALGFFGVFALLTIILKYLSVMLNLIFKQQKYLVSDIEKIGGQ